jgi:large subunit ribosomal protein L23
MALFSRKTDDTKEKKAKAPAAKAQNAAPMSTAGKASLAHILRHARITEKATMHSGAGVYTFDIAESATKREVMAAMRALYNVTPAKVAVVTVPTKVRRSMRTGRVGVKHGGKKAYVYLKKGETITIS